MEIKANTTQNLGLTFRDTNGNVALAPAGTTCTWFVKDMIEGKAAGSIAALPDEPLAAILTPGDPGAEGTVIVTVGFPDGTAIENASPFVFTVTEPTPASVEIHEITVAPPVAE